MIYLLKKGKCEVFMDNQGKRTQQIRGINLKLLMKLFIGGIVVLLVVSTIIYSGPLSFTQSIWESDIEQRWRMFGALSRRITGMSLDEVQEILGSPYNVGRSGRLFAISYPLPRLGQEWQHIIIIFNENGAVERVLRGNPLHFGLGG